MNANRTVPRDELRWAYAPLSVPQQFLQVVRAARSVSINNSNQIAPTHQDHGAVLNSQQYEQWAPRYTLAKRQRCKPGFATKLPSR